MDWWGGVDVVYRCWRLVGLKRRVALDGEPGVGRVLAWFLYGVREALGFGTRNYFVKV